MMPWKTTPERRRPAQDGASLQQVWEEVNATRQYFAGLLNTVQSQALHLARLDSRLETISVLLAELAGKAPAGGDLKEDQLSLELEQAP